MKTIETNRNFFLRKIQNRNQNIVLKPRMNY